MEICDGGRKYNHDIIAFTSTYCPLCGELEKTERLEKLVGDLEEKIDKLEAGE